MYFTPTWAFTTPPITIFTNVSIQGKRPPTLTPQDTYRWNGNTIGDLPEEFSSRIEGRGCDRRAHICINDNGSDRIQNHLTDLQQSQCPREIINILQFRKHGEKGHMTSIGKYNVGNRQACIMHCGGRREKWYNAGVSVGNDYADHSHQDCGNDADKADC